MQLLSYQVGRLTRRILTFKGPSASLGGSDKRLVEDRGHGPSSRALLDPGIFREGGAVPPGAEPTNHFASPPQ